MAIPLLCLLHRRRVEGVREASRNAAMDILQQQRTANAAANGECSSELPVPFIIIYLLAAAAEAAGGFCGGGSSSRRLCRDGGPDCSPSGMPWGLRLGAAASRSSTLRITRRENKTSESHARRKTNRHPKRCRECGPPASKTMRHGDFMESRSPALLAGGIF